MYYKFRGENVSWVHLQQNKRAKFSQRQPSLKICEVYSLFLYSFLGSYNYYISPGLFEALALNHLGLVTVER